MSYLSTCINYHCRKKFYLNKLRMKIEIHNLFFLKIKTVRPNLCLTKKLQYCCCFTSNEMTILHLFPHQTNMFIDKRNQPKITIQSMNSVTKCLTTKT